jgi:hypothetical protein
VRSCAQTHPSNIFILYFVFVSLRSLSGIFLRTTAGGDAHGLARRCRLVNTEEWNEALQLREELLGAHLSGRVAVRGVTTSRVS